MNLSHLFLEILFFKQFEIHFMTRNRGVQTLVRSKWPCFYWTLYSTIVQTSLSGLSVKVISICQKRRSKRKYLLQQTGRQDPDAKKKRVMVEMWLRHRALYGSYTGGYTGG